MLHRAFTCHTAFPIPRISGVASASMPRWVSSIPVPTRWASRSMPACRQLAAASPAPTISPLAEGTPLRIGPYFLPSPVVLAPMAGVTDRPFRILCRSFGAGLAASEMISADQRLWHTTKSRQRMNHEGEPEPRVVQLTGADPDALAQAASANVALGAQIIDLNMGCPAKKV